MKTTKLFTASILFLFFFSGCHVDNVKVVETEKETLECMVGKWMPENADPELNDLEFHAATAPDGLSGTVTASGGIEGATGTWTYKSIGELDLSNTDGTSHFKLLDCKRGIANGLTIYIKE